MKNLKNLGIALTKSEQKTITGGLRPCFVGCFPRECCQADGYCYDKNSTRGGGCIVEI